MSTQRPLTRPPIKRTLPLKQRVLESLDRGIGRALKKSKILKDIILVITADHSTPSTGTMIHSGEPVPILFTGPGVRVDRVKSFNEIDAAGGALGFMRGPELMDMILNYCDRAKLSGMRDCAMDRPYWPGDGSALKIN